MSKDCRTSTLEMAWPRFWGKGLKTPAQLLQLGLRAQLCSVSQQIGTRERARAGIVTVLITEEEDEDGAAPPMLVASQDVVSVVSTGNGDAPGP